MKHLYPTGDAFIHDWPTAEIDVEDDVADELLKYHPPVYSLEPTGWPPEPEAPAEPEAPEATEEPAAPAEE